MTEHRNAFQDLVATRRSIRHFTGQAVARDVLQRLLEAACRAPSAHNRQPWRFVVLEDLEIRRQLSSAMSEPFRADLARDGLSESQIERLVARGRERMLGAAAVVLLFVTLQEMDQYPDEHRRSAERIMAVQSVALAGGHLLLAAHAEGLGACWVCAPLFAPDVVRRVLDLPDHWEAQGMIALGHPAPEGPDRKPNKLVQEVTRWR